MIYIIILLTIVILLGVCSPDAKQLVWEADRERQFEGRHWKQTKGRASGGKVRGGRGKGRVAENRTGKKNTGRAGDERSKKTVSIILELR